MPLLTLDNAGLHYGHVALLDHANLSIDSGERIALIGRNGEGKSSLMKVLLGETLLDDGEIWRVPHLKVAYLIQEVPNDEMRTVFDIVASGIEHIGELIKDYHHTALALTHNPASQLIQQLTDLQNRLEREDGWRLEQKVEMVLSKLGLPADATMDTLSGGYKRRTLLARALVSEPDILLLDEPTNHLDIEAILWLENFLQNYNGVILFVSHDRELVKKLATRILELDRGQLTSWPGNFEGYLKKKDELLAIEVDHNAKFDKKLAQEEAWIRQGVKARRKRNEGRVRALQKLREQFSQRRGQQGRAKIKIGQAEESGRVIAEVIKASVSFGDKKIINNLSLRIMRGEKIGIIGANGSGKSTLIKLILGEIKPDSGKVKLGTNQEIAYFSQTRDDLDLEASVLENINDGKERVEINGGSRHVIGYLRDFLFPAQRVHSPVKTLSGGERNRLLLARIFTKSVNLLVLDEPTNDLDVETLELLEDLLAKFEGTLLLVSHDRQFLDNVVTSTLVMENDGKVSQYVGGYNDYLRQRSSTSNHTEEATAEKSSTTPTPVQSPTSPGKAKKLSYKDQRELDSLPKTIEQLENEQDALIELTSQTDFYKNDQQHVVETLAKLDNIKQSLEQAYQRWAELEV